MKSLYLITTRGLGDFYVAAGCTNSAEIALENAFHKHKHGSRDSRKIINIKWIASEMNVDDIVTPFSSRDNNLLISYTTFAPTRIEDDLPF